jgi:hypothetical protein
MDLTICEVTKQVSAHMHLSVDVFYV